MLVVGVVTSGWGRIGEALAYDNIGCVGELRRRLELPDSHAANIDTPASPAIETLRRAWQSASGWWQSHGAVPSWLQTDTAWLGDRIGRWRQTHKATFSDDAVAGITVALVAIPQSLACAQLAGVPAYFGLYASFLPTIVGAVFGSSPQLSTGPTAMTSLLTAASVAPLAAADSQSFITYVVLLSLIAGGFQLLFGLLRMGALLNFLSHPVLMGFVNAAALIIGLSQLPALLGMPSQQSEHFLADIWHVLEHLPQANGMAVAFGVSAILALALLKRAAPRYPGVLLTIVVVTLVSVGIDYADHGGEVVGAIPSGLPPLQWPTFKWEAMVKLLPAGFVIALISFMEAMSSAKLNAMRTRQHWDQNRELVGQGLAKIAASFCQSMPVSGSFSRSAVNAGARSYMSSVVAAVVIVMALLFLSAPLYHVPKSALAAIVMISVVGLIDFGAFRKAWRANRDDGMAAAITFAATLAFAPFIQNGIVTGALLSLGLLLYRMMRPKVSIRGAHHRGRARQDASDPALPAALGVVRFDGSLHFVTSSYFEEALINLEQTDAGLHYILVQCGGINDLDATGVEVLRGLISRFRAHDVILAFSELKPQVREVLDRTQLTEQIGKAQIFDTDEQALAELGRRLGREGGRKVVRHQAAIRP